MDEIESAGGNTIDFDFISLEQRVELLAAYQRARAQLDAREQVLLYRMATDPLPPDQRGNLDKEWIREDVACAMTLAPAVAQERLDTATMLVTRLPDTLLALGRGEFSRMHAVKLAHAVDGLPDDAALQVQDRVLGRAPQQTLSQFRASVNRAVLAVDPRGEEEQHRDEVTKRRVVFTDQDHGVTELWSQLPTEGATVLHTRLNAMVKQLKKLKDGRTADQLRADALVQLALGTGTANGPVGLKPAINVTVALSTLLEIDEQPGELDGYGAIPASLARALAFDATGTWRRLLTDENGNLVDVSADTYRPPINMARLVEAQHPRCVFPCCNRRAVDSDLDHIIPWGTPGGDTTPDNLEPLCDRHHHLKHETNWHVQRLPDGTTRWTSPTGHTYDRPPHELPRDTTRNDPSPPPHVSSATEPIDDPPPF